MGVNTGILLWKKNTSGCRYCNTSVRQYWNTNVPVLLAIRQYCHILDLINISEFGNTGRLYCQILEHSSIWDFSGTLFVFISNEKTLVISNFIYLNWGNIVWNIMLNTYVHRKHEDWKKSWHRHCFLSQSLLVLRSAFFGLYLKTYRNKQTIGNFITKPYNTSHQGLK